MSKHLIVIGGGAAGFFCAINAARMNPALKVTLLEKSGKLLSKVKVSGGGRCNVTHHCFDIADMSKRYPRGQHFVKKAFHRFFTTDTIKWFEERAVKIKAEKDGRMFPVTDSSQTIIDCLLREAYKYGVEIIMNADVRRVKSEVGSRTSEVGSRKKENGSSKSEEGSQKSEVRSPSDSMNAENKTQFIIELSDLRLLTSDFLCIACGGYPKSSMFDWIKNVGHSIEDPVPSLFTFNMPGHPITKLMGVAVEKAVVKIQGTKLKEEGPLLITHWGLSGPVILRLSAWGARELAVSNWQFAIRINWAPDYNEQSLREKFVSLRKDIATQKIINRNPFALPQRLWEYMLEQSEINSAIKWADLPSVQQNKLIRNLCDGEFAIKGKTTFKEEFVTAGGVKLNEVDPNTMMSRKIDNLFFAGEILDVDGITGGFNFQNAWTSGFVAATEISKR